jgi:hypothetical protein
MIMASGLLASAVGRPQLVVFGDSLYVWLPRKVAKESSSSVHHGVWWTGATVPVQGEEKDRSRYPVMLAVLSCSHSLKCARVKSMS